MNRLSRRRPAARHRHRARRPQCRPGRSAGPPPCLPADCHATPGRAPRARAAQAPRRRRPHGHPRHRRLRRAARPLQRRLFPPPGSRGQRQGRRLSAADGGPDRRRWLGRRSSASSGALPATLASEWAGSRGSGVCRDGKQQSGGSDAPACSWRPLHLGEWAVLGCIVHLLWRHSSPARPRRGHPAGSQSCVGETRSARRCALYPADAAAAGHREGQPPTWPRPRHRPRPAPVRTHHQHDHPGPGSPPSERRSSAGCRCACTRCGGANNDLKRAGVSRARRNEEGRWSPDSQLTDTMYTRADALAGAQRDGVFKAVSLYGQWPTPETPSPAPPWA